VRDKRSPIPKVVKCPICNQAIQPVERDRHLGRDIGAGISRELKHGVSEGGNLTDDFALASPAGRVQFPDQVAEVVHRVVQERVAGLEGLHQLFLVAYGGGHRLDLAADLGLRLASRDLRRSG
jgi:hypothetical protein